MSAIATATERQENKPSKVVLTQKHIFGGNWIAGFN